MSEIKYVDSVALETFLTEIRKEFKQQIIDMIYPVGSIYISFKDANPAIFFGGTWERIQGRFLLAADMDSVDENGNIIEAKYKVNTIGGSEILKTDNIPEFTGRISAGLGNIGVFREKSSEGDMLTSGAFSVIGSKTANRYGDGPETTETFYRSVAFNIGQKNPNPILPPYLVVYMWRRIDDNTDPI